MISRRISVPSHPLDFPVPTLMTKESTIVRNPTLASRPLVSRAIQPLSQAPRQQTSKQYLTVSSEGNSTFTELDGDDLVDVDYVSEYSLDLSNDDDDENFEDIQTETYLRNLFYSIDRLTFDDLTTDESPSNFYSLIELPKNLIAECHVWRQKFRLKRSIPLKSVRQQRVNVSNSRVRNRRTSTEQAIISKVIDWSVENSSQSSLSKLASLTNTKDSTASSLDRPLVKVPKPSGGWMQQQPSQPSRAQPQASSLASRITLPPIVNPKRPQSEEKQNGTNHAGMIFSKPATKLEFTPKEDNRQSYQTKQAKQTYPLQTSQSFNEQSEKSDEKNIATNRASASSSYSRITLDDLLDQKEGSSRSVWSQHRSPVPLTSSHLLKLPVIKS